MTNFPSVDDTVEAIRLRRRIQAVMRQLRRLHPWPPAQYSEAGYFRIPISSGGSPHSMPLGFVGSIGCRWAKVGGCTMCDYGGFEGYVSNKKLIHQTSRLLDLWGPSETEINLSCLGSFFDEVELHPSARLGILREIAKRKWIDLVGIESRANHVTTENIRETISVLGPKRCLEIGMGLESKNDFIRNVCINKGLSLKDFERAVKTIHNCGAHAVGHVLLKPPFLTESEAIKDAVETINYLESLKVRRIVLMVCNVKAGTMVGELYSKSLYRAPWLWSVLKTVQSVGKSARKRLLIYGFKCGLPLLAAGSNCKACTNAVKEAIESFNGTSNPAYVTEAMRQGCSCKKLWEQDINNDAANSLQPLIKRISYQIDKLQQA